MTMVTKKDSSNKVKKRETSADKDSCFTIMPFGGYFDLYYESIYKPAIEKAGLISHRADDIYRPGTITNDIWTSTKESKMVLADLSGKNPNVFYELGLAHALAKPAILITESLEDVPFDLRQLRVIVYDKNIPSWGYKLQDLITNYIIELLKAPLDAVLPTFLNVKDTKSETSVTENEKELISIRQEIDFLRRQLIQSTFSRDFQLSDDNFTNIIRRQRIDKYYLGSHDLVPNYNQINLKIPKFIDLTPEDIDLIRRVAELIKENESEGNSNKIEK